MEKEKLSDGWKILSIEKCINNQLSGFACAMSKLVENEGYVQLRPFNIEDGKLNLSTLYQVPLEMVDESKYFLEKGDILFNNTNSTELVGKSTIADKNYPFAFSNHINRIRVNSNVILPEYFHSYLRFMWSRGQFARHCKKWIGQSGYTLNKLKEQMILVPPLEIQREVVDKLDRQMAQIEVLKSEIEVQTDAIDILFRSHLKDLFNSIQNVPQKKISTICEKPHYGYTASSTIEKIGPKMLRITDIQNHTVNWDTVPYCICSAENYKKYELMNNDIVFVRTGATTGKNYLIKNPENSIFASYLIRLRVKSEQILSEYLYLFFQSPQYWSVILKNAKGGIMPNFNATMLSNLKIPLPSLDVQRSIVKRAESLFYSCQQQQDEAKMQLSAINQLPESILNEVFGKYELPDEV